MTIHVGDLVVPFHVFCRVFPVVAGEHDQAVPSGKEQISIIDKVIIHPDYTGAGENINFRHNICIIRLANPFQMNENVKKIELSDAEMKPGTNCTVSGWGAEGVCEILKFVIVE